MLELIEFKQEDINQLVRKQLQKCKTPVSGTGRKVCPILTYKTLITKRLKCVLLGNLIYCTEFCSVKRQIMHTMKNIQSLHIPVPSCRPECSVCGRNKSMPRGKDPGIVIEV